MEPLIVDSAHMHDLVDEDILHAFHEPLGVEYYDDGFSMTIGPDRAGNLLEIGSVVRNETIFIVHAMPAGPT